MALFIDIDYKIRLFSDVVSGLERAVQGLNYWELLCEKRKGLDKAGPRKSPIRFNRCSLYCSSLSFLFLFGILPLLFQWHRAQCSFKN